MEGNGEVIEERFLASAQIETVRNWVLLNIRVVLFDVRRPGEKLCSLNSSINQVNTAAKKKKQHTKHVGLSWIFITSLCSDSPYELLISFYLHRGLEYEGGQGGADM